jgi:ribose 5-phosphate isomerase RpiB
MANQVWLGRLASLVREAAVVLEVRSARVANQGDQAGLVVMGNQVESGELARQVLLVHLV